MINLYNYSLEKLEELMLSLQEKKYRATQLFKWIYEKRVTSFDEMSDVSKSFREVLNRDFCLVKPKIHKEQRSKDGTIKLLLELEDGDKVETVLMRYNYGNAVCVSSEVGCNMGCAFCASGLLKKKRELLVSEMIGQVLVIDDILKAEGNNERVTHVVVMGTGEPFDNYENVMDFIRILNHPHGLAIGARHITVSTCGIIPKIQEFMNLDLQVNLAISLHAPTNALRSKIMPINNAYPLDDLVNTLKEYIAKTNRRVTIEYVMLNNVNDSLEDARNLANLIKGMNVYVNLIPYNETSHLDFKRSDKINSFYDTLKKYKINVTVRREFGSNIDAACGQLRAKEVEK